MIQVKDSCLVKLLTDTAKVPQYAHEGDIGADIFADETTTIPVGERKLISTGFCLSKSSLIVDGYFRVAPRSGLAVKGIDVGAGVVDFSYRGEVKVLLINNSKEVFMVKQGETKIAQLIYEKAGCLQFEVVEELDSTERLANGFGSTG